MMREQTASGLDTNGTGFIDTIRKTVEAFDANGSLIRSTPPSGSATTCTYDVRNKLVGFSDGTSTECRLASK